MRRALAALAVAAAATAGVGVPPVAGLRGLNAVAGLRGLNAVAVASQAQPDRGRLWFLSQSPFVGVGGEFALRLRIGRSGVPANADVVVTIYRSIQTRSEFEQTLADHISRSAAVAPVTFAVSALNPDANGDVSIRIPLRDPAQPAEPGRTDLGDDDAVFPVRVELRERTGALLERVTTHLVYLPGSHIGPKLALSLVFPVQAGLGLPPDGPRQVPGLDELTAAIQALDANHSLPFALAPSPETVASLAASREDRADRALEALRRLAADHVVVGAPYVPISLPSLLAPGLGDELTSQLSRGSSVLTDIMHARPDTKTWVETEPLDPESVDELLHRGIERVVATDPVLDPVPDLSLTLSRPFVLAGREEDLPAAVVDAGLAAHFDAAPNQVLEANHLLADLAVLWLDAPGSDRRGVVAMPPAEWRATRPFLETLAAGLNQNPVMEPVTLDTIFSAVEPANTPRGTTLVRHPANVPAGGLGEVIAELRQVRRRLTSLGTVLAAPTPGLTLLDERLLVAESSQLRSSRPRQAYLTAVETGIADHLGAIEMPQNRSITLTARRGQIPVTFQNRTGSPARVVVSVQSDKLEFPGGASRPLELARRNTTERFPVVALTSGAFPLRITLQSPDGNLVIGRARLTVRSTAASRVSLAVSASAAVFLAVWWGRHALRGRRARRLVPA